jgi:hypothetical protein
MQASGLRHPAIARLDLDGLVKVLQRKGQRMKKAVVSLDHPFPNGMVRKVAVVADRNALVTGVLPRVEMILHDVAIRTARWIVAEVTRAFSIPKSKQAESAQHAQQHGENNGAEAN